MTLRTVSPEKARNMLNEGAILVDIRDPDEHAREHIAAARSLPLSTLEQADLELHRGKPVIFHCRSGQRTQMNATKLQACAGEDRKAGLPVVTDRRQPIEMQRQVQIVAGALGLGGVLLGAFVSPAFFAVPGFIGAGLLFAGLTGTCGMAKLLKLAPWNRGILGKV